MRKYYLDPYVVSLLYKTENDEDTLKHYQDITGKLMLVVQESIRYYLQQKSMPEEEINKILDSLDKDQTEGFSPETMAMLKEPELVELLSNSIDGYGKIIYDSLLPTLDAEDRKELSRYLEASEPIIKQDMVNILTEMLPKDESTDSTTTENIQIIPEAKAAITDATIKANESAAVADVPVTLQNVTSDPAVAPEVLPVVPSEVILEPTPEATSNPDFSLEKVPTQEENKTVEETTKTENIAAAGIDWENLIMEGIEKNKAEMDNNTQEQSAASAVVSEVPSQPVSEALQGVESTPVVSVETPVVVPLAQTLPTGQESTPEVQSLSQAPMGEITPTNDLHQSTTDKLSALGVDLVDTAPEQIPV